METVLDYNEVHAGSELLGNALLGPTAVFMTGSDGFVVARDGGRLVSVMRLVSKTNDALRKTYILNS
jgi:hypothetical protein